MSVFPDRQYNCELQKSTDYKGHNLYWIYHTRLPFNISQLLLNKYFQWYYLNLWKPTLNKTIKCVELSSVVPSFSFHGFTFIKMFCSPKPPFTAGLPDFLKTSCYPRMIILCFHIRLLFFSTRHSLKFWIFHE